MLRQENSYKLYSEKENIEYWNMEEIVTQMPFLYSKSRSRVHGNKTYKKRNFPGYLKGRGQAFLLDAFLNQDAIRLTYRRIEADGQMPHLFLITPFGKIQLNTELAEFFLETSEIADFYVHGWRFTAE